MIPQLINYVLDPATRRHVTDTATEVVLQQELVRKRRLDKAARAAYHGFHMLDLLAPSWDDLPSQQQRQWLSVAQDAITAYEAAR